MALGMSGLWSVYAVEPAEGRAQSGMEIVTPSGDDGSLPFGDGDAIAFGVIFWILWQVAAEEDSISLFSAPPGALPS